MKLFLLFLASVIAATADPGSGELRSQARAAEDARKFAAASELYEKAADAALAAGDPRNAFHDLHMAGAASLQMAANERTVVIARRAITLADGLLPTLTGSEREAVHYCRIECRGQLERSLAQLGHIAEGYAEVRRIWRDIEEYRIAEENGAPGDPRQTADLGRWSPKLRSYVWRATTREGEYLDIMGRTHEAAAILRHASAQISALGRADREENFYAAKIRPALALVVNFLGYRPEAMEIQRAAIADTAVRLSGSAQWTARLNLLRAVQQYEGPSRANLDQAEACQRALVRLSPTGRHTNTAVLVERMRATFDEKYDATGNIRRLAAQLREEGMLFDSLYGERDALVAGATKPGLDGEFIRLLNEMRKQGNKRGEPTLYREYADYLRRIGRPAEALPLYREALRLTESFGWTFHVPRLRIAIIGTFGELHDFASAEAEWSALERLVATLADLPADYALEVRVARIQWHMLRGEGKQAAAALDAARAFADSRKINAWLRGPLDRIKLDPGATVAPAEVVAEVVAPVLTPVSLQPSRVETNAASGDPLRARFALRNPDSRARTGEFRARGPAIQLGLGNAPRLITGTAAAGGVENELRFPIALGPGEELGIVLEIKGAPAEGAKSSWLVAWRDNSGETAAEWRITTERDPFVVSVLNANQLRRNPFCAISFTHQIVRRADGPGLANIRFIASTPLRLEYYDAATHHLLAVDAEGNGRFTDPGDVLLADADANLAPDVAFDGKERLREIEVLVFSTAAAPAAGPQTIVAELLIEDRWVEVARNELE